MTENNCKYIKHILNSAIFKSYFNRSMSLPELNFVRTHSESEPQTSFFSASRIRRRILCSAAAAEKIDSAELAG